jgi:Tol biopolymer transport system component
MNPDGSNLTLLTGEPASNSAPAWSGDGAWIAFQSRPHGTTMSQLYVMQADGSNVIRVGPELANDEYPAWQP